MQEYIDEFGDEWDDEDVPNVNELEEYDLENTDEDDDFVDTSDDDFVTDSFDDEGDDVIEFDESVKSKEIVKKFAEKVK
jgi:hypothetical protein